MTDNKITSLEAGAWAGFNGIGLNLNLTNNNITVLPAALMGGILYNYM
jgi:hypothetical protein